MIYSFPSGDPLADFHNEDAAKEERLDHRPVCNFCGYHIQESYGYNILGIWVCEDCIRGFREEIEE